MPSYIAHEGSGARIWREDFEALSEEKKSEWIEKTKKEYEQLLSDEDRDCSEGGDEGYEQTRMALRHLFGGLYPR
jgi:hypothetical protein